MKNLFLLTSILISLFGAPLLQAKELKGISMADDIMVDGKKLILNGMGIRLAPPIINFKIYFGGLYLESKAQDRKAVLASAGLKRIRMHFTYSVSKGDVDAGWRKAIKENCSEVGCGHVKEIETFCSYMTGLNKGDIIEITFFPDRVETAVKGEKKPDIISPTFGKVLLSIWMGPNPPNSELQEGLLGLKYND